MYSRDADRDSATVRSAPAPESAAKHVDLEMTLTFEPEADPFALGIGTEEDFHALPLVSVRLNNKPVAELHEALPPGTPWFKQNIEGVAVGTNELFLEATPPVFDTQVRHAVRVRLLINGRTLADKTFWSESGEKVVGTLRFEFGHDRSGGDHVH
jgi:hypothetical protein